MSILNPNHVHAAMIHTHIEHLWQEYDMLAAAAAAAAAAGEIGGGDPSIWQLLLGAPVTNADMEIAERGQRSSVRLETRRRIVAEVRAWEVKLREMGGGRVT